MSAPGSDDEPQVTATSDGTADPGTDQAVGGTNQAAGSTDHYFSGDPASAARPRRVRLDLPDRTIHLHTDAGVFSPDRVDPGTKLLLMELPELADGPVVDLGCGYGAVACTVALRHPDLAVVAVDVNPRARQLCERNAAALGVDVTVLDPDRADGLRGIGTIVSNPPIRIGKSALHALLVDWLGRLRPSGTAYLVVNKNLGADSLARWLTERGHHVRRLASRQGYRVLSVAAAAPAVRVERSGQSDRSDPADPTDR